MPDLEAMNGVHAPVQAVADGLEPTVVRRYVRFRDIEGRTVEEPVIGEMRTWFWSPAMLTAFVSLTQLNVPTVELCCST